MVALPIYSFEALSADACKNYPPQSNHVRGCRPRGRVSQVAYAHIAGQMLDALALSEDFGRHAVALALVDSPTLAYCDTGGILSPLFRVSGSVSAWSNGLNYRESVKGD